MTGIIEQMQQQIAALNAAVGTLQQQALQQQALQQQALQQQVQPVAQQPGIGQGIAQGIGFGQSLQQPGGLSPSTVLQPPPANVTGDQITALIQPHLDREDVKSALSKALASIGINSLPETPVERYGEVYQLFSSVIQQFTTGQPNVAAGSLSII